MKSAEKVRKGEWEQFVGNLPGTKIPKSVEKDVIVICRLGIVHFSFFLVTWLSGLTEHEGHGVQET